MINGYPFDSTKFNKESGQPLFRIRDIFDSTTDCLYSGEIPDGFWIEHQALLVGMDGDFNSALWAGGRGLLNQRVCKVVPDEAAYSRRLLVWFYDLRTNANFTPKQNPLRRAHLDEFVAYYKATDRAARKLTWSEKEPTGRWRSYSYDELAARDKCNLDVTWLREEGEGDDGAGTDPAGIARAIIDDVQSALAGFAELEAGLAHLPKP